jgi:hypothetical protein
VVIVLLSALLVTVTLADFMARREFASTTRP